MRKVVPREGPRAPLFYSGLVTLCFGVAAMAQDVRQADLERCAIIESADARLACFEALARGTGKEPERAAETPPPARAAATFGIVETDEAASAAAETTSADSEPAAMPDSEQTLAPGNGMQESAIPENLGLPEDRNDDVTVIATVVEVERGRNNVLYFHFEDGQIWRQIEGRRFSYPRNGPFDVEITTGLMREFRLRLVTGGPMTRIRRLK